ncbi:MAG: hypothetical protein ABSA39_15440 [Edaphobacter sp.]
MQARLEMLKRLAALYISVEEMHSVELTRTTAAVREAQQAIVSEDHMVQSARVDGRGALQREDSMGWMMAETLREAAARRRQEFEQLRLKREELKDAAREQYVASRLKKEQIQRVFNDIAARVEMEEGRRTQAALDDRFAARRRWTDAREKLRNE